MQLMAGSVLDETVHQRLLADIEHVCSTANVPQQYVHQSMKGIASAEEIAWVQRFHVHRREGMAGLALLGVKNPETRMMAICGALIRNFIDARIIPLNTMLAMQEKNLMPDPTCLLVPNMFLASAGKSIPAWKVQIAYDVLLNRFTMNKPTIMYVESLNDLANAYGKVFSDHIESHYKLITI
jgi:hypothetical protein